MEKFWIIYLIPCGLIIAYFLWCHYKNRRKKGNELTMPDQTVKDVENVFTWMTENKYIY